MKNQNNALQGNNIRSENDIMINLENNGVSVDEIKDNGN